MIALMDQMERVDLRIALDPKFEQTLRVNFATAWLRGCAVRSPEIDEMNRLAGKRKLEKMDGMITEKEIKEMPVEQKLRLIEALWDDISRHDRDFDSPSWHRDELLATEERRRSGLEETIDWDEAKDRLRNRRDEV